RARPAASGARLVARGGRHVGSSGAMRALAGGARVGRNEDAAASHRRLVPRRDRRVAARQRHASGRALLGRGYRRGSPSVGMEVAALPTARRLAPFVVVATVLLTAAACSGSKPGGRTAAPLPETVIGTVSTQQAAVVPPQFQHGDPVAGKTVFKTGPCGGC